MILYHGSNCIVDKIDLDKCHKFKDFGKGFYTTELEDQAWNMAKRTAKLFGGKPVMNEFLLDEQIFANQTLNIKKFPKSDIEWATFVINNRNREFKEIESLLCNTDNKYDVVIGPVADDDIRVTLELYIDGRLTSEALLEALKYKDLSQQISFHSLNAINFLTKRV